MVCTPTSEVLQLNDEEIGVVGGLDGLEREASPALCLDRRADPLGDADTRAASDQGNPPFIETVVLTNLGNGPAWLGTFWGPADVRMALTAKRVSS